MRSVTVYEASDGTRFNSAEQCAEYEMLSVAVAEAIAPLGERPNIAHGCYVQQDRATCLQVKRDLLKIIRKRWKSSDYAVFQHPDDAIHPMSFVGRLVDDSGIRCLQRAWGRLAAINWDSFREYDQPYFAIHENEASPT